MSIQDIQANKLNLINWILQLQDVSVIEKLKSMQEEDIEVHQWQKDIVLERIRTAKPEDYILWDEAKTILA